VRNRNIQIDDVFPQCDQRRTMSCFSFLGAKASAVALLVINVLLTIGAGIILGIVSVSIHERKQKEGHSSEMPLLIGMVIVMSLSILISFMGCCGACKRSKCCLYAHVGFLVCMTAIGIIVLVILFTGRNKLEKTIKENLEKSFNSSRMYRRTDRYKEKFGKTETDEKCCGINGVSDYPINEVPSTCCNICRSKGCLSELVKTRKKLMQIVIIMTFIPVILDVLAILFSLCLASSSDFKK
jgi:CD63 antigen